MKKLFLLFVLAILPSKIFAQETLTISTYYPSPYGVYQELRLSPSSAGTCDANNEGALYYDSSSYSVRVCKQGPVGTYGWQDFAGSPSSYEKTGIADIATAWNGDVPGSTLTYTVPAGTHRVLVIAQATGMGRICTSLHDGGVSLFQLKVDGTKIDWPRGKVVVFDPAFTTIRGSMSISKILTQTGGNHTVSLWAFLEAVQWCDTAGLSDMMISVLVF